MGAHYKDDCIFSNPEKFQLPQEYTAIVNREDGTTLVLHESGFHSSFKGLPGDENYDYFLSRAKDFIDWRKNKTCATSVNLHK